MPTFHFTQFEFNRQVLELPNGTFSVGRSSRNQIILEDASVSKEHAELLIHGTEVIVRDRGSQNGCFVEGVRVQVIRVTSSNLTIRSYRPDFPVHG